jgi:hypothetical protein
MLVNFFINYFYFKKIDLVAMSNTIAFGLALHPYPIALDLAARLDPRVTMPNPRVLCLAAMP